MKKIILLLVLLIIAGCAEEAVIIDDNVQLNNEEQVQVIETEPEVQEKVINSFHYQLQSAAFLELKELDAGIIVVDIDDSDLNKTMIQQLNGDVKIVLSYLSIGEAEDYRSYWQKGLSFVDEENSEWEGNYKVKYWDEEWQEIGRASCRERV